MATIELKGFRQQSAERIYGTSVLRVATQFTYVHAELTVEKIAEEFVHNPEVKAIGVVDARNRYLGVIDQASLFYRLGRPYGRDILSRRTAEEVMTESPAFFHNKNVFTVAQEIDSLAPPKDSITYFGLVDAEDRFTGLFSSLDILAYLSNITQQDIFLAGQLQERLVKDRQVIEQDGFSFYAFSQYAKGMGGDFYGIYEIPGNRWFFTLCDVSGKGVAASVITSMLWGMFRTYDWSRGLVTLVKEINRALIQTFHLEKYVTGVFGIFNPKNRDLRICDMGHSLCYVIRGKKTHHIHGAHINLPVGIELNLEPQVVRTKLKKNDLLVLLTDGLVEQENTSGQTQEAEQWISSILPSLSSGKDPREFMLELFNDFRKGIPQQDDLSALFLRCAF